MPMNVQARIRDFDARLRDLAKPILVLKHLNWPDRVEESCLASWRAGRAELPDVTVYIEALERRTSTDH